MRLLGVWEDEYFNSQPHKEADDYNDNNNRY